MNIRAAEDADREAICTIHQSAARHFGSSRYTPAEIESWVGTFTPASYDLLAADRQYVVGEDADAVAGFGCLNWKNAEIAAVFVAPPAAGRGVGAALLRELERIAIGRDIRVLRLQSSLNAVAFYERAGYTIVEAATYRTRGGMDLPVVKMFKEIR